MEAQRVLLLVRCLLPALLLSEGAKILTISSLGGSHVLLMHRLSQILQDHGHNITMLSSRGRSLGSDLEKEEHSFQVISWRSPGDLENEIRKRLDLFVTEALHSRENSKHYVNLMEILGTRCSYLLRRHDIMDSLKNENFDLIAVDAFDLCSFLIAEKLEKLFVSILPTSWQVHSTFDNTIKEHFQEGSRPVLSHLLKKAELWFVNSDFAFEFARPLLPNTVNVAGLMIKPIKPVPQELENFIATFGDSGFVLVALGSIVSRYQSQEILKEMNAAFARLPQGVIWKCKPSHWPKDVKLAANVKIMDWLPQNDLLAHPRIRLLVTHGGMNSVMEAIQHGVPMVGIPVFDDQHENLLRVEAKKFGVSIQLKQMKAETLALKMKQVIEDKRYKSAAEAASIIKRSQPLTPTQRLVGWIDHILQTGGAAHLKPHAFQQPWYEQYLLDVLLFLLVVTLGTVWLCGKLVGLVARWLCRARKLKQA